MKKRILSMVLTIILAVSMVATPTLAAVDHVHDDTCGYSDGQCFYELDEAEESGDSAADAAKSGEAAASLDSDTNDEGVSEGVSDSGSGTINEGTGEGTESGQENNQDEEIKETGEASGEAADAEEETEESEESAEESLALKASMSLTSASGNGWTLDDNGKLTISSDTGMSDWNRNYSTYLSQVKSVVIGDSVTYLSSNGFRNGSFTSVSIGSGVTTIAAYAFQYCYSLTSITINKATTNISDCAFHNDGSITDVYYSGSETEWNSVSIGYYNTYFRSAFVHYNSPSAHTHTHSTSFNWTGYSSCTVTVSCSGCSSTKTLNCTVSSEATSETIIYTAKATIGTETYSDTKTVPRAPAPTVTIAGVTTSSITVTAPGGYDQDVYGVAVYSINGTTWQPENTFDYLSAGTSYTVYVKYMGNLTYAESDAGSTTARTADATYTVSIPDTATVGDSAYITIDEDNLDLGIWGEVIVTVKDGLNDSGQLILAREGDTSTTITSQMLVNQTAATSSTYQIVTFKDTNTGAVLISFEEPAQEAIPGGNYSGTVVFEVTYSQSNGNDTTNTYTMTVTYEQSLPDLVITESNGGTLTEGEDYTYESGILTVLKGGEYTIEMNQGVTSTSDTIKVGTGDTVTITLSDVDISTSGKAAIDVSDNSAVIILSGSNTLYSSDNPAIHVNSGSLVLSGSDSDTLTASTDSSGAAIGSGSEEEFSGSIVITGGTITSSAADGAGIGSGRKGEFSGTITISSGTVTGSAGTGAGIGSGYQGKLSGTINIINGAVTGSAITGAGIGSGCNKISEFSGVINISGGTVTGSATGTGAGIGSGEAAEFSGSIIISGGTVTAVNSYSRNGGAGIGAGGYGTLSGSIHIIDGAVEATSVASEGIGVGRQGTVSDGAVYKLICTTVSNEKVTGTLSTDELSGVVSGSTGTNTTISHSLAYAASGNTITESCTNNCGHSATVTLAAPESLTYDGNAKTASISYGENWMGGTLTVKYLDSAGEEVTADHVVNAGSYTAQISVDEVTASVNFEVTAAQLSAPENLEWDSVTPGKATWNAVDHAVSYSVQLYRNGEAEGSAQVTTETNFTFTISNTGSYTFQVTANGEENYGNSNETESTALNFYTVTWLDADGTVLEEDAAVACGAVPSYDGEMPAKAADAQYTYTFTGWMPEVSEVTGNVTYTATYSNTDNTYIVEWVDEDGTVLEIDTGVAYGDTPSYDGDTPTKAADAQYTYLFAGWTPEVSGVTGDVTYTAVYTSTEKADPVENYYTITATAGEGGSITLTAADMTAGGYAVYEITPDDGYEIGVVTVDGTDETDQVSAGRYTFEDIQGNHTISVTFKRADPTDPETEDPETDDDTTSGSESSGTGSSNSSDSDDDSSSSGSSLDGSGTWIQDGHGWRYVYGDGSYEAGKVITGSDGESWEQISWKQIGGRWWSFGADGYLATGWVLDRETGLWYYVDETSGMKTGWHDDREDGRRYYLDTISGHMLTGWQWIGGKWYYFNEYTASPTWVFDGNRNQWVYDESTSHRPFGSLYIDEETPDGYVAGKDGSREESGEEEQQTGKQAEE